MDSIELTIIRTGAATAVATKYLARADAKVAIICGCGNQGRISLRAIMKVRSLERAYAYDIDDVQARKFANELSEELSIEVQPVSDFANAVRESDVCVTCTPSKQFFLKNEQVAHGTFIAAVGADNENKQELDPRLLVQHKVIVDSLAQAATIGELHHALEAGLMEERNVHAELCEVVAGKKSGRTSKDEIIIFDSTGMALQDAVTSVAVYEKAVKTGAGFKMNFAE
jgi:ornithine cyclodeaminase/alanine dehydrogenase-like protein (mu-crystallin family)